jgi:FAD/FMN-containing dehydrogenase
MYESLDRADPDYEQRRRAAVWNALVPDRRPHTITIPEQRADVAELVRAATSADQRIAVKSGGHNWLGACLRDDGLLIDLGQLDAVQVDPAALMATVEPGATHKRLADAIVPYGLAFPIGHCPTVGVGGYLMAGGMGWNLREWGPGCWNIAAADVVTAHGEEVRIDRTSDPELFWGLCGGSAGFPGIVTRFHLRLLPLPVIRARRVTFSLDSLPALVPAVAGVLASASPGLEMSLIARKAHWLADQQPAVTLAATAFRDTERAADEVLRAAWDGVRDAGPVLADSGTATVRLNDLEGEGGWEEGLRYFADDCWVAGNYETVGRHIAGAIAASPSDLSRVVIAFSHVPEPVRDVAFTAFGDFSVNFYATWATVADDQANVGWVRQSSSGLASLKDGNYIGETDLLVDPARVLDAYPAHKWERLLRLIRARDPERRFHGFLGYELSD